MLLFRLGGGVRFLEREPDKRINNSSKLIETMKGKISAEDYKKLKDIYVLDYALFGYD